MTKNASIKLRKVNLHQMNMVHEDLEGLFRLIKRRRPMALHFVNSYSVIKLAEIGYFHVLSKNFAVADGKYISLFYRLTGKPALSIRGSDFFSMVLENFSDKTHLILGSPGVGIEKFKLDLKINFPRNTGISVFEPPHTENLTSHLEFCRTSIRNTNPDFVWVAVGTPKQDLLISELAESSEHGVFIGIGAAINFVKQKEAPLVIQKIGMEWFYRLLKEPRRLWRRYLIDGPKFVFVLIFNVLNLIRGKI